MKKVLLSSVLAVFAVTMVLAQAAPAPCSELFISEYLEGTNNNKAIEIYNPTNATINLSNYQLARNDNGTATVYSTTFPAGATIAPYKTYVVILDKRDTTQLRNGLEYPAFDGYQVWDTCRNASGQIIIDTVTGRPSFCLQFDTAGGTALPRRGTRYNDFLDLKCRANGFLNPVYNTNRTMYFNGNDAVILFRGTPDVVNFTNAIDMVGVYNDPGMVSGRSWKDYRGFDLTLDKTLVRKQAVRNGTGLVAYALQDTFRYADWLVYSHNSFRVAFQYLGSHTCDCDANKPTYGWRTCNGNLVSLAEAVKPVDFKVFPNPTSTGTVNIEAEDAIEEIRVLNLMGQVVEVQKMDILSNSVQVTLNNVQKGFYFVEVVSSDNRRGVKKLVIE